MGAAQFVASNPQIVFVPILQNLVGIIWVFMWVYCATFLMSQVSDDIVPSTMFKTYDEAFGTADKAGKCTDMWPAGGVYLDANAASCSVSYTGGATCYRCSSPRFWLDYKFGYSFFAFWWHNFF